MSSPLRENVYWLLAGSNLLHMIKYTLVGFLLSVSVKCDTRHLVRFPDFSVIHFSLEYSARHWKSLCFLFCVGGRSRCVLPKRPSLARGPAVSREVGGAPPSVSSHFLGLSLPSHAAVTHRHAASFPPSPARDVLRMTTQKKKKKEQIILFFPCLLLDKISCLGTLSAREGKWMNDKRPKKKGGGGWDWRKKAHSRIPNKDSCLCFTSREEERVEKKTLPMVLSTSS